jgi:dTDP-glucose pyrophosphorylase
MKKQKALAIMAAGLGSRFGGLKQLHYVTSNDYSIIDFSIYDAIQAGFNTIIFIVREDILNDFKTRYEKRLNTSITIKFVIQDTKNIPDIYKAKYKREKPWGTGHALLMLKDVVTNDFALINADDFYGKNAFQMMHDALFTSGNSNSNFLLGYALKNTLSNNGSVSRGECIIDNDNVLVSIHERTEIKQQNKGVIIYADIKKNDVILAPKTIVSMNFWGFSSKILEIATNQFNDFLESSKTDNKTEFYITTIVDYTIKNKLMPFKVLPTSSQWYGITYKSDIDDVSNNISQLIKQNLYPEKLW